jgi:hypothetical protein
VNLRYFEKLDAHWEVSDALSGRGKYRIGGGGSHGRVGDFARALRFIVRSRDADFDIRVFRHAHQFIVMEVALLHWHLAWDQRDPCAMTAIAGEVASAI